MHQSNDLTCDFFLGSAIFPSYLGGRIVYFNLLILSIFLYNYYTSSLVSSLLSTQPIQFKTIKELANSDLKFGIEDQPYTTTYILQENGDIYIQKLNSSKIYESGKPNFLTVEAGIAKVKEGGFAYHTEATSAYPLIAKTFNQDEICDLNEIDFLPPSIIGLVLPKHSQYTELFMIRYSLKITDVTKRRFPDTFLLQFSKSKRKRFFWQRAQRLGDKKTKVFNEFSSGFC